MAPAAHEDDWWRRAAVYQVYPRSFADTDGDGIGDLRGVTSRVAYLAGLGVDAVWLSPFYRSPLADGGYDVADHRAVDPRLGTLADFRELVDALHAAGLRIVIDIVPNHTSDEHPWFAEAAAPGSSAAARDRYVFRDGRGTDGDEPPSDWRSEFGGSSWSRAENGSWYLHNFAPQQPDLNWRNAEVREDFVRTLRFWADLGVDGFRIDMADGLAKDLPVRTEDLPTQADLDAHPRDGSHPMWDRDEVQEIYAAWRRVFAAYTPPKTAVAEAWVTPERRQRYASQRGLGQAFNFDLLESDFDPAEFRSVIATNLDLARAAGSSSTWVLSNHDFVRHATRYGLPPRGTARTAKHGTDWLQSGGDHPRLDRELGLRRARAAAVLEFALPGSVYLYQGEELGLHEVVEIPDSARQDPSFFRNTGVYKGRDGARVPLPWTASGRSFGFSTGASHLPQPPWFADVAVAAQDGDQGSTLELYRGALRLRRRVFAAADDLRWDDELSVGDVLALTRGSVLVITNFGAVPVRRPPGTVLLSSAPVEGDRLPGATTTWIDQRST